MLKPSFTDRETSFLRSLDTLDEIWGYQHGSRADLETKTHYQRNVHGIQKFTDPIFRTIHKVKRGQPVHTYVDLYSKLHHHHIELPREVCVFAAEALRDHPGFEREMRSLAAYPYETFAMKVVTECAQSFFLLAAADMPGVNSKGRANLAEFKSLLDQKAEI
jgi:hypothetical protein